MIKPDFFRFVDFVDHDAVREACGAMYEQGAVVVEATPRPDKGRDVVILRGWKVSPYRYD